MSGYEMRRAVWIVAVSAFAAAGLFWAIWPAAFGGQTSYITTYGNSMEPGVYAGDLALVRPAEDYRVGDVAAYQSEMLGTAVMHRITAVENGRYTFQGDNNTWLDPEQPTQDKLIGKLAVRIPQGGVWLERLTSPPLLALSAFALLTSGGTAAMTRRRRRRNQRRKTMSRHTTSGRIPSLGTLPVPLQAATAGSIILAALGGTLAYLAWSGPVAHPSTAESTNGAQMVFSYTADVGRSPAYDGTIAESPDPIFRKLSETVDVNFAYQGEPGEVTVTAELSTPEGWRSTLPLAGSTSFSGNKYEGTVELDLEAVAAKAQAASEVTGLPAGPVTIALTPKVETSAGSDFLPTLSLNLTPLQLALVGDASALTVTQSTVADQSVLVPRTVGPDSWNLTAAAARLISGVMLLTAMIAAVGILVFARRTAPADEGAAIRRRYAALLVRVHPMPMPHGRPVIDVTTFATLAKLAERYGLLVLHWARSEVETFVVQDENITYRYRTGSDVPARNADALQTELIDRP